MPYAITTKVCGIEFSQLTFDTLSLISFIYILRHNNNRSDETPHGTAVLGKMRNVESKMWHEH